VTRVRKSITLTVLMVLSLGLPSAQTRGDDVSLAKESRMNPTRKGEFRCQSL
jgi:hypothetical protein